MDKLQWFKFSPSSWMMGRIQRCSEIAQGRFIRLCCSYWNHGCEMYLDDAKLELEEDVFNELIKNRVIYTDDEYVFIRFLDDQYSEVEKTSNKGKLYALKRWKPDEYNKIMGIDTDKVPYGSSMGTHKEPNAEEIRKEKKRKENTFTEFWDLYDKKKDRSKSLAKWMKLKEEDIKEILDTVEAFVKATPDEQYRPNPSTYLNNRRWEDEVKAKPENETPKNLHYFMS